MQLIVEEGVRSKLYHSIKRYARANNKYMKDYDKNKNCCILTLGIK